MAIGRSQYKPEQTIHVLGAAEAKPAGNQALDKNILERTLNGNY